jgi:hypothetical protein
MKFSTKKKKQLETVKDWLAKARSDIEDRSLQGWQPEFSLLIAVEQLVKYLEMEENGE